MTQKELYKSASLLKRFVSSTASNTTQIPTDEQKVRADWSELHTQYHGHTCTHINREIWEKVSKLAAKDPQIMAWSNSATISLEYLAKASRKSHKFPKTTAVKIALVERLQKQHPALWEVATAETNVLVRDPVTFFLQPQNIDTDLFKKAQKRGGKNPRISCRSLPAKTVLCYLAETIPGFSKSAETAAAIEDWLQHNYPLLWEKCSSA